MIENKRVELKNEELDNIVGGTIQTDYSTSKGAWFTGIDGAYNHKVVVSIEEWSAWKAIAAAKYTTEQEIIDAGVLAGVINNESYFD